MDPLDSIHSILSNKDKTGAVAKIKTYTKFETNPPTEEDNRGSRDPTDSRK